MVSIQQGNPLMSRSQVLVVPVSCESQMTGPFALEIKKRYPTECQVHIAHTKASKAAVGDGLLVEIRSNATRPPEFVYFLYAREREGEAITDLGLTLCLQTLEGFARKRALKSVAIPSLTEGGTALSFEDIFGRIQARFKALPVTVSVYAPRIPQ